MAELEARVEALPGNRELAAAVERKAAEAGGTSRDRLRTRLLQHRIVPLRVPGLAYRSRPQTGADLQVVGDAFGGADLIATDETGTVEDNARKIAYHVRHMATDGRRVALLSASKGSADVRQALESRPELGDGVAIWVDLVGVLEGTPLLDGGTEGARVARLLLMPDRSIRSLSHETRRRAVRPERFPASVRAVHLAAFPRTSDFSPDAQWGFGLLQPVGLNDGYVMLDSYLRAPGRVLIVRGSDHYLRPNDPATARTLLPRLVALMNVLLDELGPPPGDALPVAE